MKRQKRSRTCNGHACSPLTKELTGLPSTLPVYLQLGLVPGADLLQCLAGPSRRQSLDVPDYFAECFAAGPGADLLQRLGGPGHRHHRPLRHERHAAGELLWCASGMQQAGCVCGAAGKLCVAMLHASCVWILLQGACVYLILRASCVLPCGNGQASCFNARRLLVYHPLASACRIKVPAMVLVPQPDHEGQAPYSWFLIVAISTGVGECCWHLVKGQMRVLITFCLEQRGWRQRQGCRFHWSGRVLLVRRRNLGNARVAWVRAGRGRGIGALHCLGHKDYQGKHRCKPGSPFPALVELPAGAIAVFAGVMTYCRWRRLI